MLAFLPYAVGFHPSDSVVVASLRPPRGRIGLVARLDTADLAGPDGDAVAAALAHHLARDGARRVFVAVYTDLDPAEAREPGSVPARALGAFLATPELPEVLEPWVVGRRGYAGWRCADATCCPAAGRPLRELDGTQVAAHMVLAGERPARDRSDLVPRPEPSGPRRRAAAAAARRVRLAPGASRSELAAWRAERAEQVIGLLDDADGGGAGPAPRALGELAAGLADTGVRDVVLAWLVHHGVGAGACPSTGACDLDVGAALGAVFRPGGVQPRPALLAPAQGVLEAAARVAPRATRVHVLTTLAWVAWWSGEGARAGALLEAALVLDPDHALAGLLDATLAGGIPPGWARSA